MITLSKMDNGDCEIQLADSFDFESHKDFRNCIKDAMAANPKTLLINFARVEYIDSSALGMLMLAKHEAEAKNCKVQLTNVRDGHAGNVLRLVKFDQMFSMS